MKKIILLPLLFSICGLSAIHAQVLNVTATKKDACAGASNGSITITVLNTTTTNPPYTYLVVGTINGTSGPFNGTLTIGVPLTIPNLTIDSYFVLVSDNSPAVPNFSTTLVVTDVSPGISSSVFSQQNNLDNTCTAPNGFINTTISGGSGAYNFAWTGPAPFTAATQNISNLAGGSYNLSVTDQTANCSSNLGPIVLTDPVPNQYNVSTADAILCAGDVLTIDLSNTDNGVTYTVLVNGTPTTTTILGDGTPKSIPYSGPPALNNGDIVTVRGSLGLCTPVLMNGSITVTVNPLPVLVAGQTKTICSGNNVGYEILLTPANFPAGTVFNWPDPDGAGPATAGVNVSMGVAGTIHINDVLTNVTGAQITVTYVVTPTSGAACTGAPQNVDIKVNPAPAITAGQTKTICSGDNVGYEILLTPANLPAGTVFNWPDPDGAGPATAGVNVAMGAAGTIHINDVLTNVTGAQTTVTYVVTPTSGAACAGAPQNVDIKVNPAPVLVAGQTKTICSGDNVGYEILLTPANLPAGTVFNWPDPDGAGPATAGVNVAMGAAGTIHINDVLTNVTGAQITVTYVVTPTSGAACAGVPQNVDIKVNPAPVLVVGQTKTICSGDNVGYEILLTPANLPVGTVFNWPDPDGAGPATAGVNVAMGVAGTIHINDVLTNVTGAQITVTYVVTPTSGAACAGVPQNVDIKVNPIPVITAGQTKTICSGDNVGYEILLTPVNSPAGTVFNWPDPDGVGPATAGVNVAMGVAGTIHINDVLTNVTGAQTTVTYVVTPSVGICAGTPQNVDIKVNPAPALVVGQTKTICSGSNVGYEILLTPANLPLGTVFNWPDPDGAGPATAGVNVSMGVAGTIHINDVLTNVTGAQITVTYVVTPTSGAACTGVPQNVDIKVNPAPAITAGQTKTICSGDNVGYEILLTPANLPAGTVFNWPDPDGAGPATAGVNVAMGAAGTIHINDVLTNVTGAQTTVTYVVTPTSGAACAGAPQNVDIKVNPAPVLVAGQTKTICSGDNVGYEILLTPANLPAGTVFNWPDPDGAGPATAGVNVPMGVAGTIHINDVLTNVTGAQITVTYVVTPTSGAACAGAPKNVDIKVNPAPVLVVGQTKTICSGDNVGYEILLTPANLPLGTVFNWPDPDGAGPATAGVNVAMGVAGTIHINDVLTNVTGAQITVTYVVTPTSGAACAGVPQNVDIKVNPIPVITAGQTKTICSGDNVGYEILLTPANLPAGTVFNWPDPDGVGPATAGVNVPMGVAGTIHINDVLTNVTGAQTTMTYVVTPSVGICAGSPQNVDIKVNPAPALVVGQTKTICSGNNVAYEILLNPANLPVGTVFNWPDPDGVGPATAGVNVPMGVAGTIHINDVLTNVTGAQITVTYVVTPTSGAGCAGTPQNVDIKVDQIPVITAGQTKTICSGDNVNYEILLTPANIPAGTVFNWPDPDGVGPATAGVNVAMGPAGTIHINDVLTNVTGAQITVTYVVTPSEGVCTGTPENVDIKVDPAPVLVAGQTKTICSGDNVGYEILLTPANLPAGTVFNWPDPDGAGPATAGVNVAMGAAGTIHINDVLTNVTGAQITVTYVVTPTSGAACAGAPKNVDIKVNPAPVLVLGQTKTICSGDNVGYEILLTPANLPVGTVFNWPDPDGAGPATAGVNVAMGVAGTIHINDVLTNVTGAQITVTYVVTPSAGICAGVPQNVDIKVNPAPVITAGQTKTICSGDNVGYEILLTPVNLPAGTEFNWPDPDGVGPATAGVNVAMGVAGTVHINDVLTNVTGAQITVTYVVTPSAGICAGVPQNVDIKVNPAPAITAGQTKTICSGDNVGYEILLTPANLPAGTVFNWPDPDGAGPATAGVNVAMGAAGTIHINDVLTNVTGAQITVTYVVTPTSGAACAGAPQNIAIKVNPAPVLVAGQTKTICSGSNVGYEILLTPANLPAGTVFNWPDPDGAGPATAGVNVAMGAAGTIHINDVLTNGTAVPVTVTYVVTPSSGACTGTTQNVDIVIDQGSTANAGVDQSICTGSTYTLVGSSVGGAATTGAWSIASQPVGGDGLLSTTVQVGNPASVTFTATVVGNYKLTLTTNDPPGVCAAVSDDVTITVTAIPVLVALQAKTICGNQSVAYEILLNPANQPANTVFNWPDPDGAGPATAGVNVSMGVAGTKHINDILTNTTSAAITVTYQVTPSVGSCVGNPQNIDITVNPSPVVQTLQTKTICSGELTGYEILLSPANQPAGVTFSWPDPDGTGSATSRVNVPEGAAGTIHINDQLFNGTASAILVQYSIIPKSNLGCFGITQTVDIIVNPGAVVNAGSSQLICSGGTIPLSGASIGGLATTGTWSIVSSPAGGDGLLSLTTPTATPSNVTFKATVAGDYVLRLTTDDPAGSCPSISDDATITVRSLNDPLCTGGPGGGGGNVNCGKFNINITEVRPSCSSQNNGQISITVTGGAPSPNYTLTLYDSMRAPLPPFTKGVTVAPSTTYTFNSLSPSLTYFYKVDDGTTTCTLPYSLPIQTTVSATASGFVDAQCYNQAVGQATVTVTSGGASPYEYSLDAGTTWVSFTSPVTITNLMPAALPYSILVRDDATDQCPAQVSVTIGNAVTDIQITSTVTDATCANNDGSVQITSVSGGSGSYTYQFDGQSQAGLSYNNLSGGNHTFVITDTNGCSKTFPFTVNFPGLVNFTTQVNNPDCSGGGNNGSIVATISSSGTFDFGITTDPVNDPASFQAVTSAGNSTVTFTSLTRGVYYVVAKPSGALCPSRHPADSIKGGPYGVDFSFISNNFVCYDTKGTVKLFPIQGSPSVNYNYEIFSSGSVVQSGVITQTQKLDTVRLTGLENGNYQIHLFQYQPACPDSIFSPAKSFTIMGPKTPSFDTLAVTRLASEYNMATGSMKIDIQNILEPTYRIKLQLVAPDISGQTNKHNGFDSLWVVADARVNQIIEFNATELYGGLYRLHVRDTLGCVKIYDLTIPLDTEVFIPNIFTPNNDGKNDNFEILYLPDNSHIIITNRWGKQVLNSSAFTRSPDGITSIVWNGGAEVDGVYYYTLNTPSKTYTGWVEVKH